jgi:hypothetical protein
VEPLDIAVDSGGAGDRPTPTPRIWEPVGSVPFAPGVLRCGGLEVRAEVCELGTGMRIDLSVHNPPGPAARAVSLHRVRLRLPAHPHLVLEHGFQSWSPVARRTVNEISPLRRLAPAWVRGTYHAAPELGGRAVCGDQFLLMADGCGAGPPAGATGRAGAAAGRGTGGLAGFLDGASHLSTCVVTPTGVVAVALLDAVTLRPGEHRSLDPLWLASGDPGRLYSEYLGHWAHQAGARAGGASPLGWGSWYQYFWKVDPAVCRSNLAIAAGHGIELFQLDDGYQRAVGDWLEPNDRFAGGEVPRLAQEITGAGLQAGIWTAPFLASPAGELARRHPEWLARRPGGRDAPCRAMWNPQAWKGWAMALDTTRPDVLDHLRETFGALTAQGWSFHKIDFCYAAAMPARRAGDGRMTRAESLRAGIQAVRDGIGETSTLLGCGIPLAQSVGLVDALRVSPDTGPSWAPGRLRLPGYPDLAPAALSALQVGVLRAPMHRRLWLNDPDCLLLRPTGSRLSAAQRAVLAAAVTGTGAFTLLSDDLATYGDEEWALVETLRGAHAAGDRPLDIADPFAPAPVVTGRAAAGRGGPGEECLGLAVQWEHARPGRPGAATPAGDGAPGAPGAHRVVLSAGTAPEPPWAVLSWV